ncbi:MAG TPA: NAD-dependent epimerase/dehydratase family protein [Armatimonadota bacterium]|nr:NAD-dependent epimerase/dehydratase family protein [Armatimonadota bacterium]
MTDVNQALQSYDGARVVVTGGLGFVGSNVSRALVKAGARVTVLDDGFTGRAENLGGAPVEIVTGSVTDPETLRKVIHGAQYVFHLACRNIIVSTREPFEDCQVNTVGTVNALLASRDAGVTRVVYASSASVYGNPPRIPVTEDDPTSLLSPYAASKFAGECFCQAYYESFNLPVTSLRYSNVYGTMQRPDNPYCGVVSKFMDAALKGEPLRIFGDGEQTRDFTYIDDVVDATLLTGISPRAEGQAYNVATGREISVNRLAEMVASVSGVVCRIERAPKRDIDTIRRRVLSAERIRHDLRWSAQVGMEEGLERTFDWLRGETIRTV